MPNEDAELAALLDGIQAAVALWHARLLRLGYAPEQAKAALRDLIRDAVNELDD